MAILPVKPTRNELLKLKRRLRSVSRGHKLLKDKQDGLMQEFLKTIHQAKDLRAQSETALGNAFQHQILASSAVFPEVIQTALEIPTMQTSLQVTEKNIMSVRVPKFEVKSEGHMQSFGFAHTTGELDIALDSFASALPLILQLAAIEKAAENMAWEIESTRRRVNALEHRIIPDVKDTIKSITMKLDESERSAIITSLMMKEREVKEAAAAKN